MRIAMMIDVHVRHTMRVEARAAFYERGPAAASGQRPGDGTRHSGTAVADDGEDLVDQRHVQATQPKRGGDGTQPAWASQEPPSRASCVA